MKRIVFAIVMFIGLCTTTVCNADPVGGAKYKTSSVSAHSTDVYHVNLRGYESTLITLRGDHDTDLDLYVYDENGNLVDSDNDYSDNCICEVTPKWTGNFTIKVVNRGSVYNRYTLEVF